MIADLLKYSKDVKYSAESAAYTTKSFPLLECW